jgi:hypothetical protein
VPLEHEHASPDLDLVSLVSRGDYWLIPRHLEFESDRLQIKIDCGENISILEILPGSVRGPIVSFQSHFLVGRCSRRGFDVRQVQYNARRKEMMIA